ncbi:helix-turn-helix domain-containing protein [Terrimonas pollutisoli]|uniref:helix-turn-helix domain-containing protein n=1 Tax=Terrimonas pollutisoli TaxID=3034147 RepID=UPI0023EB1C57|nr:helix-turn-helix domain-containing protein [Terrimonas sp. H1YJ31]
MSVEIVTKEDLQELRTQLINDLKTIIIQARQPTNENIEGYKTSHVRKILGCSVNKLVALRITRKLRMKKIGGTNYYNKEDVKRLLEEGY